MRVLLINYEMDTNSPVVPWQARVATALADRCTSVHVLTDKVGAYDPRPNLTIDVLPHWPLGVPRRLGGTWLANWHLLSLLRRHPCDVCFIHMASNWACRFGWLLRLMKVPVLLWYAHGSISRELDCAIHFINRVITSTPEGCRVNSPKVRVIGQAIDTSMFKPPLLAQRLPEIVYVGRISARKRILLILDVFAALKKRDPATPWTLKLVGPTLTAEDVDYKAEVEHRISDLGLTQDVTLTGPLAQAQTATLYTTASLHLNVSETGSMDKTVMEALAAGCPVLTTNIAFRDALAACPGLFSASSEPQALASAILELQANPPSSAVLTALVTGQHDFAGWMDKVYLQLTDLSRR